MKEGFEKWEEKSTYMYTELQRAKERLEAANSTECEEYNAVVERLVEIDAVEIKEKWMYTDGSDWRELMLAISKIRMLEESSRLAPVFDSRKQQQHLFVHLEKCIEKCIQKAAKEQEKAAKEQEKAARLISKLEQGLEKAAAIIEKYNVHYVAVEDKVYFFDPITKMWHAEKIQPFCLQFKIEHVSPGSLDGIRIPSEWDSFKDMLSEQGRMKAISVCTFNPSGSLHELNLLTQEWIEPKEGPVDPWIDLLMNSVTGTPAVREHVEKCLVWKYLYPWDYELPAQCVYGVGGAGKNKLMLMLKLIFGHSGVAVVGFEDVFGNFNGLLLGKAVVMLDEKTFTRKDSEKMKRLIGNATLVINAKYGIQGQYDNTEWWWAVANGPKSPVSLVGDSTDRRYSTYELKLDLYQWVSKTFGTYFNPHDSSDPRNAETSELYQSNEWRLTDPDSVAMYLGHILKKYGHLKHRPAAYHAEDYKRQVVTQRDPIMETVQEVFTEEFEHIEGKDLYEVFKLIVKDRFPGRGGRVEKRADFYAQVDRLISDKQQWRDVYKIPRATIRVMVANEGEKQTTGVVYSRNNKTSFKRNTQEYLGEDRKGFLMLVEKYEDIQKTEEVEDLFG